MLQNMNMQEESRTRSQGLLFLAPATLEVPVPSLIFQQLLSQKIIFHLIWLVVSSYHLQTKKS